MGEGLSGPAGDVGHWGDSQVSFLRGETFYAAVCFLLNVFALRKFKLLKKNQLKKKKSTELCLLRSLMWSRQDDSKTFSFMFLFSFKCRGSLQ